MRRAKPIVRIGAGTALLVIAAISVTAATPAFAAEATQVPPDGKAIFRAKCGVCHLQGGTGTFMLARRLGVSQSLLEERRDFEPAFVIHAARHGIQSMPRFSRAELPDRELRAIAEYLSRARAER